MYAVSYEDSNRKIPEWARLRLSPHKSTDMYGTPCTSYMVRLREQENEPQSELDHLLRQYETNDLIIEAVHSVRHFSEQNDANGKGRIIRAIKPNQILYYSCADSEMGFPEHLGLFRQAIMKQLLRDGSHEILHDFKHIVQAIRGEKRPEYQYTLPADLPAEFIEGIRSVELEHIRYGNKEKHFTLTLCKHEPRVLPFRPRKLNDPQETGINSAYKHFALHPEQRYLGQYLQEGIAQLIHFDQPSTSCAEKYSLLRLGRDNGNVTERWPLDRIISAHYFDGPNGYVVLVGPRLDDVVQPERLLAQVTGREDIKKSGMLPREMEHGTCTPFVYTSTGREAIDRIVLLELPEWLMVQQADYSIGGRGPSAHRASIQMTPYVAKEILISEFCPKVMRVPHPYQSYW
jgi:hypothetical protein